MLGWTWGRKRQRSRRVQALAGAQRGGARALVSPRTCALVHHLHHGAAGRAADEDALAAVAVEFAAAQGCGQRGRGREEGVSAASVDAGTEPRAVCACPCCPPPLQPGRGRCAPAHLQMHSPICRCSPARRRSSLHTCSGSSSRECKGCWLQQQQRALSPSVRGATRRVPPPSSWVTRGWGTRAPAPPLPPPQAHLWSPSGQRLQGRRGSTAA